ncbi:MAG: hypothetical protein HN919_06240 [Verrucomicrobia bacterium]|nr:hypothetical protein [Verrucomicrobiota bacterium]
MKRFEAPFLRAFAKKLQVYKQPDDVCVIVLVPGGNAIKLHSTVERDLQMATVNVSALHSDDPVKMVKRLQRHVMRGVGFLFGLKPAPDPHCVTKHYRTLEDLDKMGMNYCPPSQGKFRAEALKRGMTVFTPPRPQVKRGADPLK